MRRFYFKPRFSTLALSALVTLGLLFGMAEAQAARIGDLFDARWQEQAVRFWSLRDNQVRLALLGAVALGVSGGLLGSFMVVRRLSLLGDTLSHAVLPGVAFGYLWHMAKEPLPIFIGASIAGLTGVGLVHWITRSSKIKEDAAMGMALTGLYGLGICLMTMIQNQASGNKAGLDHFLFGQAAALSEGDVLLMAVVALAAVIAVVGGYRTFLAVAFDPAFARTTGPWAERYHTLILFLLTFAIVVGLQAAGVVLISALLIIPAASAFLWTRRFPVMLLLAVLFGVVAGVLGAFISFLGTNMPTGPFMVLAAAAVFGLSWTLAPAHGWLPRWWRQQSHRRKTRIENTLKQLYLTNEALGDGELPVAISDFARQANLPVDAASREANALVKGGWARWEQSPQRGLTGEATIVPSGKAWGRARELVRNHRLWERYLTERADYPPDHVHDDAEVAEHLMNPAQVEALRQKLKNPQQDPHGKTIPSVREGEENRDA